MLGRQMIMIAPTVTLAARLLSTATAWLGRIGRQDSLGLRLRRGGRFRFSTEESTFQVADLSLKELFVVVEIGFTLDSTLMLSLPVVGLSAQIDDLQTQAANDANREPVKLSEQAVALPQHAEASAVRIVAGMLVVRGS